MRLDKLIYERGTMSSEAQKVEFEVPTDMTVHEFKRICKRIWVTTRWCNGYVSKRSYQINLDNLNLVNQVIDSLVSSKNIQINRLDYDILKPEIYKRKVH